MLFELLPKGNDIRVEIGGRRGDTKRYETSIDFSDNFDFVFDAESFGIETFWTGVSFEACLPSICEAQAFAFATISSAKRGKSSGLNIFRMSENFGVRLAISDPYEYPASTRSIAALSSR